MTGKRNIAVNARSVRAVLQNPNRSRGTVTRNHRTMDLKVAYGDA